MKTKSKWNEIYEFKVYKIVRRKFKILVWHEEINAVNEQDAYEYIDKNSRQYGDVIIKLWKLKKEGK